MMKKTILSISASLAICALLLAGCAAARRDTASLYDLGPLPPMRMAASSVPLPALTVADVHAPVWLETPAMYYRLDYANGQQPLPYSASRWAAPPVQLFGQRLKSRLAQAGGVVLSAQDGALNVPILRIEADDFTQHFTGPGQSVGIVSVRASVFNARAWVAQKTFSRQMPAPSADAGGGAKALSDASDAVISDMIAWLAGLRLKK